MPTIFFSTWLFLALHKSCEFEKLQNTLMACTLKKFEAH